MSEKRFTRVEFSNGIWGVKDNNTEYEYPSPIDLLDLLNELNEEKDYFERKKEYFLSKWSIAQVDNIQLRQKNKELIKENEQLRKELKGLNRKYIAFSEATDKRLKEMMKEMMK